MIPLIIIGVIGLGLYVLGRTMGNQGINPPTSIGANDAPEGCSKACDQWAIRRAETCSAEKEEAYSKAQVDTARAHFLSVAGAATAAAGLAAGLASNPITAVGVPIALILAAGLAAYAAYLLGVLGSREVDFSNKAKITQNARIAQTEALKILHERCSKEEITKCLGLPSPC